LHVEDVLRGRLQVCALEGQGRLGLEQKCVVVEAHAAEHLCGIIIISGFVAFIPLCASLVWYYASPETGWLYRVLAFIGWYSALVGTMLLPLDVTLSLSQAPDSYALDSLRYMWDSLYWGSFIYAYVAVPFAMEFWAAGQFTVLGRLSAALWSNLVMWATGVATIAVGGAALLVLYIIGKGLPLVTLFGLLTVVCNFTGLVIIVVLASRGLVEVPRSWWRVSLPESAKLTVVCRIPGAEARRHAAEERFRDVLQTVRAIEEALSLPQRPESYHGDKTPQLEVGLRVIQALAHKWDKDPSAVSHRRGSVTVGNPPWKETASERKKVAALAKTHFDLRDAIREMRRANFSWGALLDRYELLEQVISGETRAYIKGTAMYAVDELGQPMAVVSMDGDAPPNPGRCGTDRGQICEWAHPITRAMGFITTMVKRFYRQTEVLWMLGSGAVVGKILCVTCIVASVAIIWSEVTAPIAELTGFSLSIFGRLVQSGKEVGVDSVAFFWTLLPLLYVSVCTYTTMWNVRFPYWLRPYLGAVKSFEIHPRQTDTYALLYNASYISRLQFVLCFHCYSAILQFESLHTDGTMKDLAFPAFRHSAAAKSMVPCKDGDTAARCSDSFEVRACDGQHSSHFALRVATIPLTCCSSCFLAFLSRVPLSPFPHALCPLPSALYPHDCYYYYYSRSTATISPRRYRL